MARIRCILDMKLVGSPKFYFMSWQDNKQYGLKLIDILESVVDMHNKIRQDSKHHLLKSISTIESISGFELVLEYMMR